ncbi:hypothetical protein ACSLBF_03765 [Pseudoalteromonas sp. T1lg65]|uniref:hypothetical protein n=1 Tax=Pseudoalteromonas sp. T1lg65 TaxID=2077101 RepID=UPI003F79F81B
MSILNSQRINFFGGIEVDVSVPNNIGAYPIGTDGEPLTGDDPKTNEVFDPATSQLTDFVYDNNITDEQLISMLRAPSGDYFTNGGWNIYGQHSVVTNQAKVTSSGMPGQVSTSSDLQGYPVYLLGSVNPETGQAGVSSPVMVDLNPLGSLYSQIVFGGLLIGSQDKPLLHLQGNKIPGNMGLFRKIINGAPDAPGSSMFAGTWQATFSMDEVVAFGKTDNANANTAIEQMLQTDGATGVVLQFSFFEMCPKFGTDNVRQSYNTNQDERNPSVGRIIGTIGLAFAGEAAQYPEGRLLVDNGSGAPAYAALNSKTATGSLLSVDMSIALTQANFRTQRDGYTSDTLDPAIDAGVLSVTAGEKQIATITPNYVDYYQYGGIIDVVLSCMQTAAAAENQLSIMSSAMTPAMAGISLVEQPYRIFSSDKDVYMGEREEDAQQIEIEVRHFGETITHDMNLSVSRVDVDELNPQSYLDLSVDTVTLEAGQRKATYTLKNGMGSDSDAGWQQVQFAYGNEAAFVVNTRKYQFSDFGIAKGATVTWDECYKYALRYHYLNFLGMSTVFPLNLAQTIEQHKEGIKARTSSKYWPTSLYMPIVRSMSPSQVRLINAYAFGTPWDPEVEI